MPIIASLQKNLITRSWEAINRRLNHSDIRSICILILVIYSTALGVSFATYAKGGTVYGSELGADFGQFYIAGVIFNTQKPDRIFDRDLQRRIYHELFTKTP